MRCTGAATQAHDRSDARSRAGLPDDLGKISDFDFKAKCVFCFLCAFSVECIA